ncbi:MAG TPA: DUF4157 domain-containing protein, partial [Thermoanaerobaculia bacterium]|nr:DUF4157 domain-containing protein [Thermoanaerobaculia bacterium]
DPAAPGVSAAPPSIQRLCSHCEEEGKVQRKCAHCEEEEKVQRALPKAEEEDKLERKETAAGAGGSGGAGAVPTVSPRTESRIAALRSGGGQPLPPSLRSYFEPRFGRDLSAVRLHAGGDAAEAAREVRARAFTVGRDVAFGAGEYRPESAEGKRLLAHELAHTVQQGGAAGPLRRQPAPPPPPPPPTPTALPATTPTPGASDFKIERVGTSTQGEIFFARSSATLDAPAKTQIAAVKKAAPASVRLIGYASADEAPAIAQSRADAVKAELKAAPDAVAVASAVGNAGATEGRSDFSGARSVEILVGSAPSATVDCKKKVGGKLVNPPKQPCTTMDPNTWTSFGKAHKQADDAMKEAVAAVAGTPSADDEKLIDRFFGGHDAATLATLRTNLGKLATHVHGLPSITDCGGQCDAGLCDDGSTIAYNNDVDAKSRMTLCVPAFKNLNQNDEARNLIHESAHGTSPLGGAPAPTKGTKDLAYRHERMMFQLSTAERLRNSDSYALFALFLHEAKSTGTAGAVPTGISTPSKDAKSGFLAGEEDPLDLALAKLEKRLAWASDWVGQLYGQILKIRTGPLTWATSWADGLMTEASKRFPLTAPPAKPTLDDQVRVAALSERYRRMKSAVKRNLTATRVGAGVATWTSASWVAAASLEVGPDFFRATADDQISLLLESLAKATKDVETAFIPAYVSLAAWIHGKNP